MSGTEGTKGCCALSCLTCKERGCSWWDFKAGAIEVTGKKPIHLAQKKGQRFLLFQASRRRKKDGGWAFTRIAIRRRSPPFGRRPPGGKRLSVADRASGHQEGKDMEGRCPLMCKTDDDRHPQVSDRCRTFFWKEGEARHTSQERDKERRDGTTS